LNFELYLGVLVGINAPTYAAPTAPHADEPEPGIKLAILWQLPAPTWSYHLILSSEHSIKINPFKLRSQFAKDRNDLV